MNFDNTKYDAFIKTLPLNLSKKYLKLQKNYFSQYKDDLKENLDKFKYGIERGIRNDKEHRDLANLCVFPFSTVQSDDDLNYSFIRAEPLWELKTKCFDFLLCNFKKRFVIFGECKTSINDYTDVVKEVEVRQDVVMRLSENPCFWELRNRILKLMCQCISV